MDIGNKIRELRTRKGLTLEELASRSELTKGFLSQLERDLTSPSIDSLSDILEALGTNLAEFFQEDKNDQFIFHADDFFVDEREDYFAEIYRAGYESIPVGQFEAAQVLGYTGGQTFGRILLPQMIRRVLPPVTNEVITLVKDTSLASVIGTVEMFTRAKQIVASPNTPGMLALAAAGLFYYVFNYIVAFAMERAERSLAYYQ